MCTSPAEPCGHPLQSGDGPMTVVCLCSGLPGILLCRPVPPSITPDPVFGFRRKDPGDVSLSVGHHDFSVHHLKCCPVGRGAAKTSPKWTIFWGRDHQHLYSVAETGWGFAMIFLIAAWARHVVSPGMNNKVASKFSHLFVSINHSRGKNELYFSLLEKILQNISYEEIIKVCAAQKGREKNW